MKRPFPADAKPIEYITDVKAALPKTVFYEIGAMTIAYNHAERATQALFATTLRLDPGVSQNVTQGMSGVQAITTAIKGAVDLYENEALSRLAELSVSAFLECKRYRDAIVHSSIYNRKTRIGYRAEKGSGLNQVLMEANAVAGVYKRLECLIMEIETINTLADYLNMTNDALTSRGNDDDQLRQRIGPTVQAYVSQVQAHQKKRQSLPPLPMFPD